MRPITVGQTGQASISPRIDLGTHRERGGSGFGLIWVEHADVRVWLYVVRWNPYLFRFIFRNASAVLFRLALQTTQAKVKLRMVT